MFEISTIWLRLLTFMDSKLIINENMVPHSIKSFLNFIAFMNCNGIRTWETHKVKLICGRPLK